MRVVITGGTGMIGQALAANLAEDGHEVVILSRNPPRNGSPSGNVSYRRWDARTPQGWSDVADGAAAIVNLAGANLAGEGFFPSRWTDARKRLIRDSRLHAGSAVVEAVKAASNKPGVVIQASAVGYYGPQGDQDIAEDHPPADDFLARVCVDWEKSTAPVEEMGVRRAVIRTGVPISFKAGALPRLALPFRLFGGGPMGSGKQQMPWIHPTDEAAAIHFLIDNAQASGPFNLSAPNPVTNAEFGKALGRVMGRPYWFPTPGFGLKLAFGEVASVVLTGQRAVPRRLLEMGYKFRFPEVEAALRDLYQSGK